MATKSFTAEGVAVDGSQITAGNQGASGDAVTPIKTGAASIVGTATAGEFIHGAKSVKLTAASGEAAYFLWDESPSLASAGFRVYYRFSVAPTSNHSVQKVLRAASATTISVVLLTSGKLYIQDASGSGIYTTPSALTFPGVYGIDVAAQIGSTTTNGKIKFAVYDASGNFAGGMTAVYENTACNTGTDNIVRVVTGKPGTEATAYNVVIDSISKIDSYALVGAYNGSYTAVIDGGAANNLKAATTRTLSALGSVGSPTTYEWTQTAGTSVSIASANQATASYVVPALKANGSVGIRLRVGDGSSWSTPATVTDTIDKHAVWFMKDGVLTAGKFRDRTALGGGGGVVAGAAAIGTTNYTVPAGAIFVATGGNDTTGTGSEAAPFKTLQKAVNVAVSGKTIVMRAGTYHENVGNSKTQITIQNYPNEAVWLDGSQAVTGWTQSSTTWYKDFSAVYNHSPTYGWNVSDSTTAGWQFVNSSYPCAPWPEMVFVDGVKLTQVQTLGEVGPGKFYVQGTSSGTNNMTFTSSRFYIGTNPSGAEVLISDLPQALLNSGGSLTFRGIGVRRYATPVPQIGTMYLGGTATTAGDALIENVIFADNATQAFSFAVDNSTIRNCSFTNNGLMGMHSNKAYDAQVISCLFDGNNSEHFNSAPTSGGLKATRARNWLVQGCVFKNQVDSTGLWFDECCYNATVVGCDMLDNDKHGIVWELSATMYLVDCLFSGNLGHGIRVDTSSGTHCWNNTIVASGDGLPANTASRPMWVVQSSRVYDGGITDSRQTYPDATMNWDVAPVVMCNNAWGRSQYSGSWITVQNNTGATRATSAYQITFDGNLYNRPPTDPSTSFFAWPPGPSGQLTYYATLAEFQSATGQDLHSASVTNATLIQDNGTITSTSTAQARTLPTGIAAMVPGKPIPHIGAWR